MEGELWDQLYQLVMRVAKRMPKQRCVSYPDSWILLVYLWAVLHDRPQYWACDRRHWPDGPPRKLPSPARLSERLNTVSVMHLFELVMAEARANMPQHLVKCIDAKPLEVGGYSKDRDAKRGRATHGMAKGYKLYAVYEGQALDAWRIGPMNESEANVARRLIPEAAEQGEGYLLGDSLYDSNPLYTLSQQHGLQLITPRKKPGTGLGHHRQHPDRLRAIDLTEGSSTFGATLYAQRTSIERCFGQAGNLGCGLGPLPNWVRRPRRVARWVAGKLLIMSVWNQHKPRIAA